MAAFQTRACIFADIYGACMFAEMYGACMFAEMYGACMFAEMYPTCMFAEMYYGAIAENSQLSEQNNFGICSISGCLIQSLSLDVFLIDFSCAIRNFKSC